MTPFTRIVRQSPALRAACVGLCLWAGTAPAHEDHPGSPVSILVTGTQNVQQGLHMTLNIANRGHIPVQIRALYSDLGPVAGRGLPLVVLGGETQQLDATLTPGSGVVPGIFTLLVDMADLGAGPVLVMPDV